jgi:ATP-dependent helicase/nuclease subunit A
VAGKSEDEKLDLLAENALVAEGRDAGEKEKLLRLIDSILKSDFWQRIMKAEKRYFEIPFSIKTDSTVLASGEWEEKSEKGAIAKKEERGSTKYNEISEREKLPIILTGAIDLAFLEKEGWVIADYKTDEVGEELENFVKYYGPQVMLYSEYWEEITKQKVKEAGLYFTSLDKWVKIYP